MKYLQLIRKHPFPKNGRELNAELVEVIKGTKIESKKKEYITKLFYNNLGIVSKVFSENKYDKANATVEEFLSFYYEALLIAIKDYDKSKGMAFHSYLYSRMKSMILNYYKYNGSVIHIPVLKRPDGEYEIFQLTDIMNDILTSENHNEVEHKFDVVLDDPFFGREIKKVLSKDEYKFLTLCREYQKTEAAEKMGLTRGQLQRIFERIRLKLASLMKTLDIKTNLVNKKLTKKKI